MEPIELKLPTANYASLDELLVSYLKSKDIDCSSPSQRHIGSFEAQVAKMCESLPAILHWKASVDSAIGIYSRFHSCVEEFEIKLQSRGERKDGEQIIAVSEESCLMLLEQLSMMISSSSPPR